MFKIDLVVFFVDFLEIMFLLWYVVYEICQQEMMQEFVKRILIMKADTGFSS